MGTLSFPLQRPQSFISEASGTLQGLGSCFSNILRRHLVQGVKQVAPLVEGSHILQSSHFAWTKHQLWQDLYCKLFNF